jgi:hypothetical protein
MQQQLRRQSCLRHSFSFSSTIFHHHHHHQQHLFSLNSALRSLPSVSPPSLPPQKEHQNPALFIIAFTLLKFIPCPPPQCHAGVVFSSSLNSSCDRLLSPSLHQSLVEACTYRMIALLLQPSSSFTPSSSSSSPSATVLPPLQHQSPPLPSWSECAISVCQQQVKQNSSSSNTSNCSL